MLQVAVPGPLPELTSLSSGDYLESWLSHVRGRVRGRTYQGYAGLLRRYAIPVLGEVPLKDLHPLHLHHLYGGLLEHGAGGYRERLSASTVSNLHRVLVQSLGWAERFGLIEHNPAKAARPPRPRRAEPKVVDPALATRILRAASGTRLELPAAFALATGMHRGEILGLRWADLSPDLSVAHVRRSLQATGEDLVFEEPKTKRSRRSVALPAFLAPYLERQRADQARRRSDLGDGWVEQDLVIDAGDGSAVNPDSMSSAWRFLVRRAGLPHVRFHDLRHGHATLLLCQGVHPKVVSERLGHATVGITLDIYSHVIPACRPRRPGPSTSCSANGREAGRDSPGRADPRGELRPRRHPGARHRGGVRPGARRIGRARRSTGVPGLLHS
jgi:integrase